MPHSTRAPQDSFLLCRPRNAGPLAWVLAAVAMVLAAELSRSFPIGDREASLIWPPAGLALGLAIAFGPRLLPLLAAVLYAWAVGFRGGDPLPWLLPAVGAAAGPWLAVTVLRRLEARLERPGPVGELLWTYAVGIGLGVGVSSLLGTLGLRLDPDYTQFDFGHAWSVYAIAEAFGVLVFTGLTARLGRALADRELEAALQPEPWQLPWFAGLAALVGLEAYLAASGAEALARAATFLYFPLLAISAGRARPLFQDLVTAAIAVGLVSTEIARRGAATNGAELRDLLEVVVLVLAFTVMAQVVAAMAELLRRYLAAERASARQDGLTGLANERELDDRLGRQSEAERPALLASIDIPAVRKAVDVLGLEPANEIEEWIADRIRENAPAGAVPARVGRGTYALLDEADPEAGAASLERLYDAIDGYRYRGGPLPLTLHPTIGMLRLEASQTLPASETRALASLVTQQARERGDRRLLLRPADPAELAHERATLSRVETIRAALERADGFALFGQRVEPLGEGNEPFHEVLVRLRQPDGSLLSPGEFLDVAARFNLVPALDRWVVARALAACAARPDCRLAINLSGASLSDLSLLEHIDRQPGLEGLEPGRVTFEVTETEAIQHPEQATRLLAGLRQRGYKVALDDFGTGLASFEYLKTFPFDYIKIDGSFVRDALNSPADRAVVESVRQVAAVFGARTVAEFVEDTETRSWLAGVGVDFAQGFGIHRPAPLEEVLPARPA
ncbi:MAG: EAL domain-containing protein [Thiohalospira sp.]